MKNNLKNIKKLYENQVTSFKDYSQQLEDLKNNKNYSEEYKQNQKQKMTDVYKATADKTYTEILTMLSEMKAKEKTHLDINDTSLINALTLIKSMGESMPYSIAQDINTAFKGNQSALNILNKAFKDNNVFNDEIEGLCYDVNEKYNTIAQAIKKELNSNSLVGVEVLHFLNEWESDIDNEPVIEVGEINDTPSYCLI